MNVAATEPGRGLLPPALRDTARTIARFKDTNDGHRENLRKTCDDHVTQLRDDLQKLRLPRDVIDDALYAQCALLDEIALQHLDAEARDAWAREPLQVSVFGRNDAGDELLRRIGRRLHEPQPVLPLLSIFAAVLELGFTGRFALNGAQELAKLVREIDARLERAAGGAVPDFSGPIVVSAGRARRRRPSSLTWVILACVAAGLMWFALDRWLLTSIARMR